MELPFADVERLFKSNEARLGDLGLQGFARLANTATGTQDYSQADVGWFGRNVKQASTGYDRWIDENMGGVKDAAGSVGEGLFGLFGQDRAVGREAGEQAVRGTLDYVPLIAGSLLAPVTGGASFLPGAAMSGALGAASAYEKTDSPLQTIMAGALPFVGGKVGEVGARAAISGASKIPGLGALGFKGGTKVLTPATEAVGAMEHLIAKTFADRFAGAVGSETMLNAATMVADSGIGLVEDGELRNPFTMENILSNAIDPTLVFSIGEFVQPSVVATRAVKTEAQKGRVLNADLQASAEEQRQKATTPVGRSYGEVETAYLDLERDIKKKIVDTKDNDEKEFLSGELVKLDKLRQKFREDFEKPDANPGAFSPRNVFHKTFEEAQAEYALRKAGGETPPPLDELAPEDLVNEVNAQRAEVDEPPITNEVMQSEVETNLEDGDTLEIAVEKATEVVKSKTPSFSRQIETRISQMTEDKITDVDQARNMLIEEYKVTDEKQLSTIENRLKRLGKASRKKLTQEQKEAAASAGTDAPNTGRPQTKTEDQDAFDWLDAQSKSKDPNVQKEVEIFAKVRSESKSDIERPGVNTDLINTYKEWQRLRDAGELKYGKGKADIPLKQQEVLKRMLEAMQKKRAKVPTGMPLKQSVGSAINQSFENKQLAESYADRMNLKDDGFNYKAAVRKGKHVVEATPKSTSNTDEAGTDLPPEFVVDLELLEKVRTALSQAKPEQTDSKGEPDVKVEKRVEVSEDVEVPVGKPEAMGLEEKYKIDLMQVESILIDLGETSGTEWNEMVRARELLESPNQKERLQGVAMAVELAAAYDVTYADYPADIKKVGQEENDAALILFVEKFQTMIKAKDVSAEDAERIAKEFLQSLFVSNSANILPKLKPNALTMDNFLRMEDGTLFDPENVVHLAMATPAQIELHRLKGTPDLQRALQQEQDQIRAKRQDDLNDLLISLLSEEDVESDSYSRNLEAALTMSAASRWGYKIKKTGDGEEDFDVVLSEISENNRTAVPVFDGKIGEYLMKAVESRSVRVQDAETRLKIAEEERFMDLDLFDEGTPEQHAWQRRTWEAEHTASLDGLKSQLKEAEKQRDTLTLKQAFSEGIKAGVIEKIKQNKNANLDGWKKWAQSDKLEDAKALNAACAGTTWCTGDQVSTAKSHLSGGDFYTFYKDGKPEIAIRTENGRMVEFVGATQDQKALDWHNKEGLRFFEEEKPEVTNTEGFFEDLKVDKALERIAKGTETAEDYLPFIQYNDEYSRLSVALPDRNFAGHGSAVRPKALRDLITSKVELNEDKVYQHFKDKKTAPDGTYTILPTFGRNDADDFDERWNRLARDAETLGTITLSDGVANFPNLKSVHSLWGNTTAELWAPNLEQAHTIRVGGNVNLPKLQKASKLHLLTSELSDLPSLTDAYFIEAQFLVAPELVAVDDVRVSSINAPMAYCNTLKIHTAYGEKSVVNSADYVDVNGSAKVEITGPVKRVGTHRNSLPTLIELTLPDYARPTVNAKAPTIVRGSEKVNINSNATGEAGVLYFPDASDVGDITDYIERGTIHQGNKVSVFSTMLKEVHGGVDQKSPYVRDALSLAGSSLAVGPAGNGRDLTAAWLQTELEPAYAAAYDQVLAMRSKTLSPKELIDRVLRRNGVSPDMIVASHPMFQKLFTFFDLNDVTFRELMSDSVRGKATIAGPVRELLLSGKQLGDLTDVEKLRAVEYVAGHEIGHLVEQMANSGKLLPSQQKAWTQFDQWSRTATPEELIEAQDLAMETLLPKEYQDNPVMKESLKAINSPEEFRANLISMFALGQINSPDQMGLDLLPRPVSRALHVLSEVGRVVYNAMRSVLRALPEWRPNNSARAHVYNMSQMLLSMKQQLNDTKAFYEEGRKIVNVGPDAFNYRNYGGESIAPPEDTARSRLFDFAQDFVMHFDQLTQKNRHFKELGRTVHASITEQKSMLKQVVGAITGEVDASGNPQFASHNSKLAWERVVSSPLVNKTLGDWLRLQNVTKPEGTNKPGMSIKLDALREVSPELYQRVQKLSKGDRDAVVMMRDRFENGHRVFAEMFMNHSKSVGETFVQSYLGAKMPEKWKEAPAMAHLLLEAVRTIGAVDPAQRAAGQELLAKVASQMDAQVFYKAFDLAKMAVTREAEIQATMAMAQGFSSEVRTGKHFLRWLEPDGKRHGGQGFETIKALKAYEQKLVARGATPIQVTSVERGKPQMTEPEWMQAVAEIEEKNKAYLDALDLPDDVKKQMVGLLDIQGEFQAAFGKNKAAMPTKERKFAAGRDDLDMVASQIAYFSAGTKMIHGQIMRNRLAYQFGNPEFKDPALVKDVSRLKNMLENFAVPDTEMGTNIAAFNASYMLGMNLSTGMVEVAQPMFSFVPELMNNGMSYLKSMKLIGKAQKEVTKFTLRHIPAKIGHKLDEAMPVNMRQDKDDNELWENPEYSQFMKWAASRNAISLTHMTDIVNDAETSGLVLGEISHTGKSKRSLGQRLLSPVQQYGRMSLKFYQNFTEFNARVGLIAGYELAKSQGHTGLKAYELAEEFARTVTFSGGKVNRPKNFSGRDPFYRTVGQAMYSLQGYTTGMLSMMARYYAVGTAKNDMPGVTAQDKKNARRALRTLLATQMFGAGAIGLPFAAAAIKMIEGITGLEFEREMREGLAGLLEQDEDEDGGLLADVFLHGGMNALSDRILPGSPDFGSRLAMGGIMGVNSYDGFSLSALAGPTGSVVENVVKGVTNLAQGDTAQAFEDVAPVAWKKVINMIRNDGEFTDSSGNMLTESSSAEKFAYGVGFTPQRIAKLKHYSRLQRRSEELSLNREKRWHDQVTDLYFDNPGAAMALLQSRSASDPYFDYNGAVEKIAERVERRTLPKDPRAEGSYRGTQGNEVLLRDLVGKTEPKETERVLLRENVKQTLGGGYGPQNPVTQRQLSRAQLMDQVMERMPYMPRASAAKMVDELLSR